MQKTAPFPMPPATKTLSPAELAKLEHAFATDPASEAYKPLAEAYLGMGRFMEAMVVCKKGVKAHPSVADPRVLLARVYAEQGKDKKAIEELQGALQVAPADKSALRMMGSLQIKSGDATGKDNLLKAFEADPADGETLELMQKNGVPVPKPAAPEPPPPPPQPVAAPPVLQPVTTPPAGATASSGVQQPVAPRAGVVSQPGRQAPRQAGARPSQPIARPAPAPRRDYEDDGDDDVETSDVRPRPTKKGGGASKAVFFVLLFAVPLGAAGYLGYGQYRAKLIRESNNLIREATAEIKKDTYKGYIDAISKAESALALDGDANTNRNARGLLAYAYTIRWGEHIHDESNRENAEKNIQAGLAGKEASAYLHAAEAMFDFYSGKTAEGLKAIDTRIAAAEAEKKNVSLYYLTRGILQTNSGDLEAAKDALEHAQAIAPDDPRVYVALGQLHRRRGADLQALSAFNNALKYGRGHPDGLIGTANLILDQENPGNGYCTAAKSVKELAAMTDNASPRQLATNAFTRALLISRVSRDIPLYTDKAFQKTLEDCTGVKADEAQAKKDIAAAETEGLSQDRNNPELLLIRGRRLAYENKLDEAAAEIRKAIEANPQASHFHVELAKVLTRKEGGEPAAEEALTKALTLVPASPKLLSMLGQVQYKQKKYDAARGTLEKALSDPKTKNPEARYLLGKLYRDDKKDYAKAVENLKRASEEYYADPSMAAVAYDDLAQTYELKGEKDNANSTYEKALNADKENPAPYCHYARLLAKDPKEKEKARSIAQAFLKMAPKDPCADEMRGL